ncbi:hypothetical protein [Paracoccus yeei]|uniref:hypothetical protein n=1 Tax=Paracoccus yeei TaxID=147645 RepID=UPI00174A327B|nr:hypothetical protein [Paracoccus yeei]
MVMVITVDGTGDPGTGLGRIVPLIDGMPAQGLLSLVDFDGGTNGEANPGPYLDKSGLGNNLTLKPGYDAPIQRATGLEVLSPHGAILATGISGTTANMTVIAAVTPMFPGGEAGLTANIFSANQASFDDGNPANSNPTITNYPVLNMIGSGTSGTWGLYADQTNIPWGTSNRQPFNGSPGFMQPAVLGVSFSGEEVSGGVTGVVRMMSYGQAERVIANAGLATFFDGVTARPEIVAGIWPSNTTRTAAPVFALLHSYAIYNRRMSTSELNDALGRMRARQAARGVEI